jgi:hypothetical protein
MSSIALNQSMTDQLNNLIAQSAESITCGPTCQQQKKADSLKASYQAAQTNVITAPVKLSQAEQAYYTYVGGVAGYNAVRGDEITAKAASVCTKLQEEFDKQVYNANNLVTIYSSLYTNYDYVNELYANYVSENAETRKHIGAINSDVVTSDRKTYYESQSYESLTKWYYIFRWIYILLLLAFFIGIFLADSDKSRTYKWVTFLLFVMYPIVIHVIISYIIKTWNQYYILLPKNVYKSL